MKRATRKRLDEASTGFRNHAMILPDAAQDILDSDARQRAEIRALNKNERRGVEWYDALEALLKAIESGRGLTRACEHARDALALRPTKVTR